VHTIRLILKDDPTKAEWLLQWDNSSFSLKNPEGQPVFETAVSTVHRLVEIRELYAEDKISLAIPYGSMVFESDPIALAELRAFVAKSLGSDAEYCAELQRRSLRSIPIGLAMFLVAGSLFGLYCWYAIGAPDPPPGHWIRWFGWLIHGILLILLGVALAGPYVAWLGVREWLRIRWIVRQALKREAS